MGTLLTNIGKSIITLHVPKYYQHNVHGGVRNNTWMAVRDFYHEFAENDDTPFIGYITRSTYQRHPMKVYDMSEKAVPYQTGTVKGFGLFC